MSAIKILEANSKADRKKFMYLPYEIYKDNKYWVSPLLMDMRHMFELNGVFDKVFGISGKHPFFEYGEIRIEILLYLRAF